jgi:hypothetical protein
VDDHRHRLVIGGVLVDPRADLQLRLCSALAVGVGQIVLHPLRISNAAAIDRDAIGSDYLDSGTESVGILEILEQP